jgi:hypothetical protein
MKFAGPVLIGVGLILIGVGIVFHYKEKKDYAEYFVFGAAALLLGINFS